MLAQTYQKEPPEFVFDIFSQMFDGDIKFRIIMFLSKNRNASMKEIASHVGIKHKNIARHLNYLASKGIIEVTYSRSNLRLYRPSHDLFLLETASKFG